jgi:ribonuclease/clavin/mitogillin
MCRQQCLLLTNHSHTTNNSTNNNKNAGYIYRDITSGQLRFTKSSPTNIDVNSGRRLLLNPTKANLSPGDTVKKSTTPRNVVPEGLSRFTQEKLPPQPPIEKLTPRVMCVLGQNPSSFTLNGTNLWLVGTGPRRILIDTGEWGPKKRVFENLRKACKQEGIVGFSHIVITHLHHDHCALAIDLANSEWGPCRISKWETPRWEVERRIEVVRKAREEEGISTDEIPRDHSAQVTWQGLNFELNSNYHRLSEAELIKTDGASLRVFHTPGHAPDHIVLYLEEERAVFSGDHILGWGSSWTDDLAAYCQSLHKIRLLSPTKLYPGHGPTVYTAMEHITKYISHREARERQVVDILHKIAPLGSGIGVTSRQLTHILYTNTPEGPAMESAEGNVLKILIKLRKDNLVISVEPHAAVARSSLDDRVVKEQIKETGSDGQSDPKVPTVEYEKRWMFVDNHTVNHNSSSVGTYGVGMNNTGSILVKLYGNNKL